MKAGTSIFVCDTSVGCFRCRVVELHKCRGWGAFKEYSVIKTKGSNCPEQQEMGCMKHIRGRKIDENIRNNYVRNRGGRRLRNMRNEAAPENANPLNSQCSISQCHRQED